MTKLGRGIDPLELDLLQCSSRGLGEHGLSEGHDTLLGTGDGTLEHDEVVVDLTVADEATEAVISNVSIATRRRKELQVRGSTYGVIFFLVTSISVAALSSASPLPIR